MTSGLFALAGVAVAWLLQSLSAWTDRRHKQRERRRDAALQVYEELDAVMAANHKAVILAARFAQCAPTTEGEYAAVHLGRLRGLLSIYFPDSMPLFKAYDNSLMEHSKFLRENMRDPGGKLAGPENIRGAGFGFSVLVNSETTNLLSNVRQYMDEHAEQLS